MAAMGVFEEVANRGGVLRGHALLGQNDSVAGFFECRRAIERGDAVVGERTGEQRDKALGQSLRLGVERAQESVQILLCTAQLLTFGILLVTRSRERPQVGEEPHHAVLARDERRAAREV